MLEETTTYYFVVVISKKKRFCQKESHGLFSNSQLQDQMSLNMGSFFFLFFCILILLFTLEYLSKIYLVNMTINIGMNFLVGVGIRGEDKSFKQGTSEDRGNSPTLTMVPLPLNPTYLYLLFVN